MKTLHNNIRRRLVTSIRPIGFVVEQLMALLTAGSIYMRALHTYSFQQTDEAERPLLAFVVIAVLVLSSFL